MDAFRIWLIVLVGSVAGAVAAGAQTVDLVGARAVAKFVDRDGGERDRGVVRLGRDPGIAAPLPDPTTAPSFVRLSAGAAGTFELPLTMARWRAVGRGYRYTGAAAEQIRAINLLAGGESGGAILIRTRGPLFAVDGDSPGQLEIRLAIGDGEYCARLETPTVERSASRPGRVALRGAATACRTETFACALDPAASGMLLRNPAVLIPAMPSGTMTFDCEPLADGAASTACSCRVEIDPILIPGVGDLCMTAGPGCASGRLDCGGDSGAEVDVVSDHNIGVCLDNPDCQGLCAARCAALGPAYAAIFSACEAFCAGGENDGWPCAFKQDCPGGFCAGRDDGSGGRSCHCVCSASGLGEAPGEPSLTCNASLGLSIDSVEVFGDGICGNGEESITVAPLCQAMTTTAATFQSRNVNDVGGFHLPPSTLNGAPPVCPALLGDDPPLSLVGNYPTFGPATGDASFEWSLTCQR